MGCQVLIVGNRERARHGLCALLSTIAAVEDIKEADINANALGWVAEHAPDLVIVDGNLFDQAVLDVIRLVKENSPGTRVVLVAMYPEWESVAKSAGADRYVDKCKSPSALLDTVCRLLANE